MMTTLTQQEQTTAARAPVRFDSTPNARATRRYVTLFLVLPGMNFAPPSVALLVGKLVQETVERDLSTKSLLREEPASARSIMTAMQRQTAIRLEGIRQGTKTTPAADAAEPVAADQFVRDVAGRVYGGALLSFVRHEDQFHFVFSVSNVEAAQAAVEKEVKRLGFLQLSEIGRYDAATDVCATVYPPVAEQPVTPHCVEVLKAAGLLPQA